MPTIPLHPTRGIDPHMLVCPQCGQDTGLTLGNLRKAEYQGKTLIAPAGKCREMERQYDLPPLNWRGLEENEKVLDTGPCEKCREAAAEAQRQILEDPEFTRTFAMNGIAFQCMQCGMLGHLRPLSESAKAICDQVRSSLNAEPGAPAGMAFNDCAEHINMGIERPAPSAANEGEAPPATN